MDSTKNTERRFSKRLAEKARQEEIKKMRAANGGHLVGDTPTDPIVILSPPAPVPSSPPRIPGFIYYEEEDVPPTTRVQTAHPKHSSPPRIPGFIYYEDEDIQPTTPVQSAHSSNSKDEP